MRKSPLDDEANAELLRQMRERVERWGHETYVAAPVLEANDHYFPDPYSPDIRGVRTVARRLLKHVGLDDLDVDAGGVKAEDHDALAQTYVVLGELTERRFVIDVYEIGAAEEVPLVLAHEVARAYGRLRSGPMRSTHPYRAPAFQEDEEPEADRAEEANASLTGMYLGLGLLVALGAHRYRATGEMAGTMAITRWVHECLGGLSPNEACFLLAAQAVARNEPDEVTERWRKALSPNERKSFSRFLRELRPEREALLARLGLPDEATWPAHDDTSFEPLDDDGWQPKDDEVEEEDEEVARRPIFRVSRHQGFNGLMGGTAISTLVFTAIAANAPEFIMAAALAVPVSALAAFLGGSRISRTDMCSACEGLVPDGQDLCPGCDGLVRGRLKKGQSHALAVEALPDITTFGLIAAPQDGAAKRYVDLGVKCPNCGWIPDGEAHWKCDACDGADFNTFAHGGECPHCSEVFEDTLCPRCDHMTTYEWWWPE